MTTPDGILTVYKEEGMTSHDVVNRIRRLYNTKRVGHTGTLDPLATGVLVVLIGRAAKAAEYLTSDTKRYEAVLRLGLTTDTEDASGNILTRTDDLPSEERVREICAGFIGRIEQIPPMYSALKVDGQKLCDLARRGVTVERKPREITVFELECAPLSTPSDYSLSVFCSSGTYIRTLCADIGAALGCGGIMAALKRTYAGGFSIENAVTLERLEAMTPEERMAGVVAVESLFADLREVRLSAFFEKLCRGGCEIYQKKIRTHFELGERVRLCNEDGSFFALGEVFEYPDGSAIKAIKTFELN
jgi:tRNA pseudouridine55 synthase